MGQDLIITPGATLERVEQSEGKDGFRTNLVYSGSRTDCENQRIIERTRGAKALQLAPRGDGFWELTATYPYDTNENGGSPLDPPVDTHELDVQMSQQDVYVNPKLVAALSATSRALLQSLVDRYKRGEWKTPSAAEAAVNSATGSDATILSYFKLIAFEQVDHWIFYRVVYSRIITAASPWQVQASFTGVNMLWSTGQILSWENVPSDWWFNLNGVATAWHKSMPRVQTNIGAAAKTQISYQYIGSNEASTLLYNNF